MRDKRQLGNVGVYQFFCVIGLALFGVEKTSAIGFSLVAFSFLEAPLWIIGFLIVTFSGISLNSMHEKIGKQRQKKEIVRSSLSYRPVPLYLVAVK